MASVKVLYFAARLGKRPRQVRWAILTIRALWKFYNVKLSADEIKRMADITLAAQLVETNLTMYANGNNPESLKYYHEAVGWDHGSVNTLQQQPGDAPYSTANWGTTAQCMNFNYSILHFARVLLRLNWHSMSNGQAAQAVQGSAYPDRYAQRDREAIKMRQALWAYATSAKAPKPPTTKPKPVKPVKPVKPRAEKTYTVKRNDTFGAVAKKHGLSVAALHKANPNAGHPTIHTIWPDDKLTIPKR